VQTARSLAPLLVARGTGTAKEVARDGYLEELTGQARRLATGDHSARQY
jgi:hypothetical protein